MSEIAPIPQAIDISGECSSLAIVIGVTRVLFNLIITFVSLQVAIEINQWRDNTNSKFLKSLPISEILQCVGFVIILLVESVVHGMHNEVHDHQVDFLLGLKLLR